MGPFHLVSQWMLRTEGQMLQWAAAATAAWKGWPKTGQGARRAMEESFRQEERFNFRERNCPGLGPKMARTHCSFRVNRTFSYWLFHLFPDADSPTIPEGHWLVWTSDRVAAVPQERPDFS